MKVLVVWLILCGIWSSTWIFIKLGLDAGLPPISFAALRFVIASAVLLMILAATRVRFPRDKRFWRLALATGLMQFAVNYGLLFWGEQQISSGLAAVLQATIPAFGLIFAKIYLPDEPITLVKTAAIGLGIAGVGAIFYEQLSLSGALAFAGCAAIVVGALAAAWASVLVKARGAKLNSSALLAAQMLIGVVPLVVVGAVRDGNPLAFNWTRTAVFCVIYLALVGSVAAFWMFYWLLKNMDVTKAMIISLVTPFLAVIIGNIYLRETLQWQTLLGGALILVSVGLILFQPKREIAIDLPDETALESR